MSERVIRDLIKRIKHEFKISLKDTSIAEVDYPTPILRSLVNTAMNWHHKDHDCWAIGKGLQREHRGKIPSAMLWRVEDQQQGEKRRDEY